MMGSRTIEIHRRSKRKPSKNEGSVSVMPRSSGLKDKKAATLKKVNMQTKMINKFITHIIVFGILYLMSMNENRSIKFTVNEQYLFGLIV